MSLVLTYENVMGCHGPDSTCNICGRGLTPPFLQWCGLGAPIFICGPCAYRKRAGITADLIHLAAIVELNIDYPGKTLVRRDVKVVEEAERKKWLKINGVTELFPPRDPEGAA